jgi:hypothetical protein
VRAGEQHLVALPAADDGAVARADERFAEASRCASVSISESSRSSSEVLEGNVRRICCTTCKAQVRRPRSRVFFTIFLICDITIRVSRFEMINVPYCK